MGEKEGRKEAGVMKIIYYREVAQEESRALVVFLLLHTDSEK